MKKLLLLAVTLMAMISISWGQTTILDFEGAATTTTFQYFGSSLEPGLTGAIANPDKSGINTSDSVVAFLKPTGAQVWAGGFSNPDPMTMVDLTNDNQVCVKVWMNHIGTLALKLENSATGDNWVITQPNTVVNQWEEICFDVTLPSEEGPNTAAAGHVYPRIVLFPNFQAAGDSTHAFFYDDITVSSAIVSDPCNIVLDFEDSTTSTTFQYFGSSLDPNPTAIVANPNPTGMNMSAMVTEYVKPGDAMTWAGAFSNPNPTTPIDLVNGTEIRLKTHISHLDSVTLKLEQGSAGDWEQTVYTSVVNDWEELSFDPNIAFNGTVAKGNTYNRVVLFFGLGTAGNGVDNDTLYFDDLCVVAPALPDSSDVDFAVDMTQYTGMFTQVYVSGSFGVTQWSGTENPLSDPDMDGIWTGTVKMPPGAIEYKFTIDDWAVQEEFNGTEICTGDVGPFFNRVLNVAQNTSLDTVCWNTCYACGASANITFNLGFDASITPDPGGVYVAGGAAFGAPGGIFKMTDDDMDGVYTLTINREIGFSSHYTYANGPCADYSCKEDIAGQSCADPNNFNDRFLPAVSGDTTVSTCFAMCVDDSNCAMASDSCSIVLDFEDPATSTTFQYFGSSLDPNPTAIIANPNPTGINMSANVTEYVKPGDAMTWAGAFSNPNPMTAIDLVNGTAIRLKTHISHLDSVTLKLEQGTAGDWEQTVYTTKVNEWEELTFDPNVDFGGVIAKGNTYNRVVVFFGLGTAGNGVDNDTLYFDDLCVVGGNPATPDTVDVGFAVDMNQFTDPFDTVYVRGSFNGFSTDNPMSDADMDGIWTATVRMPAGTFTYKFNLDDNGALWEQFDITDECVAPTGFFDRQATVMANTTLDTVCWESCYACGASVDITFNLGLGSVVADPNGLWVAGGGNFGVPGERYELTDGDMDGIYSLTINRQIGFSSFFTFANGACADFSCKEDISGQDCADPNNFDDRFIAAVAADTTISTCFGQCTETTDCSVGIEDFLTPDLFRIQPTQVTDKLQVIFGEAANQNKQLQIYNTNGQLVMSRTLNGSEQQVDLSVAHLPAGIYFIQGRMDQAFATQKFVKF